MTKLSSFLIDTSIEDQFKASLSTRGGYITFSNSGRRGESKQFQISLDSLIITLRNISDNISIFKSLTKYDEREWREAGTKYFSDSVSNAMSSSQTKPFFVLLSKVIKWANNSNIKSLDTSNNIIIEKDALERTISRLNETANEFYPIFSSELTPILDEPLQQIFFGAPGTGKSHSIKKACKAYEHYRITFHPDTDYSSFVGAYKPTTTEVTLRDMSGHPIKENGEIVKEEKISYKFVQQAFLKAYIAAWKEQQKEQPQPVFLVIEEINRGNCAQIFGDIFQLLDRNEEGFSDYPIHADTDLSKELAKEFKDLNVSNAATINALYDGKDIVGEVKNGSHLLLPNNLYIWATMNTSDQSLFPIDSAFKRRWDWKYIKITDSGKGYTLAVNGNEYDWWDFLKAINHHIGSQTSQEDKKLGYFFVKATKNADGKHVISADKFLSKVLFFLYGDVYKDYGFDDVIFQGEDNQPMEFSDYFDENGNAVEPKIEKFLQNLGLRPKSEDIEDAEIIESDTINRNLSRALSVVFPDGTTIQESTNFDTYLKTIERIGLEKAQLIAAQKTYVRRDEPLISKIQSQAIINDPTYSYVKVGEFYIIKGIDARTQVNFINLLSEKLNLGLTVKYE